MHEQKETKQKYEFRKKNLVIGDNTVNYSIIQRKCTIYRPRKANINVFKGPLESQEGLDKMQLRATFKTS